MSDWASIVIASAGALIAGYAFISWRLAGKPRDDRRY